MESNLKSGQATRSLLEVSLDLVNDKMHMIGKAGDLEPIHTDYIPPFGDNMGYMPLQLFLISFASCAAGSVLVLLRKMQKTISGLEVKASGIRRDIHPTSFEEIRLEFFLKSEDVQAPDMDRAIALSESGICPIWAMIKGNVVIKTSYTLQFSRQLQSVQS